MGVKHRGLGRRCKRTLTDKSKVQHFLCAHQWGHLQRVEAKGHIKTMSPLRHAVNEQGVQDAQGWRWPVGPAHLVNSKSALHVSTSMLPPSPPPAPCPVLLLGCGSHPCSSLSV